VRELRLAQHFGKARLSCLCDEDETPALQDLVRTAKRARS
jgi:hypothetical protein